jgi:hypothetical protein
MTPAEALYHLRTTVPDAIDQTIAEGLGSDATRGQLKDLSGKMRAATDIDAATALDEQVATVAQRDPPVYARIMALTKDVREQAEAETFAGQMKQGADAVEKAAETGLKFVEALALGWVLYELHKHVD